MQNRILTLTALTAALALTTAPALAEDAQDDGNNLTTYTFDDDLVHGDLVSPNGEILMARRRLSRDSLVRVRENFVPELLKSIEQL